MLFIVLYLYRQSFLRSMEPYPNLSCSSRVPACVTPTEYTQSGNGHLLAYISLAWWGWGVHALPLSLYPPSRAKLWCTIRSSWEGRYHTLPLFLLYPYMNSVVTPSKKRPQMSWCPVPPSRYRNIVRLFSARHRARQIFLNIPRENGERENRIGCEILCTFGSQRGKDPGRVDLDRY